MNPERVSMKRYLIAALIASVAIILLLFIFKSSSPRGEDNLIEITYWTHEDESREELENRLISEFESMYPNIKINREVYSSSDLLNVLPTALEAERGPDLFTLQQDYLAPLLFSGYLSSVNIAALGYPDESSLISDYIDGVFDSVSESGRIYGIPMEFTNWCLYINKRLFREAGLDPDRDWPKTWEEMVEISEKLVRREDGILTTRGFDFRYPYYLTFLVPMVKQLGGDIIDENGNLALINEKAWTSVFAFMRDWGPLGKNLGSPTYINARSIFNQGEIAMMLSGLYQQERMKRENPDFYYSDDWMVVPFPVFENGERVVCSNYCHYWCVNSSSNEEKKQAAWLFIGFLSSHENDYLDEVKLLLPKKALFNGLSMDRAGYLDVFTSDLEYSDFVYSGKDGIRLGNILENLIKEVMLSSLEPDKATVRLKLFLEELNL